MMRGTQVRQPETDDDTVDGGLATGLIGPLEGLVREVYLDVVGVEQRAPKWPDLLSLRNGLRAYPATGLCCEWNSSRLS